MAKSQRYTYGERQGDDVAKGEEGSRNGESNKAYASLCRKERRRLLLEVMAKAAPLTFQVFQLLPRFLVHGVTCPLLPVRHVSA